MTKLCPRGKSAAKRKFKVYPSAYAHAYASKICAGKIKDPSGVKRKDFRGSKAKGGRIGYDSGDIVGSSNVMNFNLLKEKNKTLKKLGEKKKSDSKIFKKDPFSKFRRRPSRNITSVGQGFQMGPVPADKRKNKAGGGLMEATERLKRQGLKAGGKGCKLAMKGRGRAYGKNS